MNKRYIASAIMTGALLVSGSAFAQMGKAPSDTPNDSTAAPLNRTPAPGATAPAPAGSATTGSGAMHKSGAHKSGTHKNGTMAPKSDSPSTTGNTAQPTQPRPVTGK